MSPQPLHSVRRKARAHISHEALLRQPGLAAAIASAIGLWSRIDAELGAMLAFMLKSDPRPAVSMYAALKSSQAQMDALEAAARTSLDADDLRLFKAVLVLIKRAGAKRNKLAHWLWGETPELKDALLLIDPDAVLTHNVAVRATVDKWAKDGRVPTEMPEIDTSRAFVYRENDIREIMIEFANLASIAFRFSTLVSSRDPGLTLHLRHQLTALPQIQELLQRSRE